MKRSRSAIIGIAAVVALAGCGSGPAPAGEPGGHGGQLTMGFSQVGAESGWRTANTQSIQDAAKAADVNLKFSDAGGKQENQIAAIRSFVQQRVDVIAFSPVVRTGWDAVLLEAKNAGIPVILTDRAVDTEETDVYRTFVGADFVAEGRRAGDWVVQRHASAPGPVNIVQLEGTTGADPAIERNTGFAEAIAANPDLKIIASQSGDFTRSGGKQVMEAFLKAHPKIDLVFAQNDDMGLGAMEAIEAAGLKPGKDIEIVAIDATHDGMAALAAGKFNYIVECNPLIGPQLMELAADVVAGKPIPARVVIPDEAFDSQQAAAALPDRKY
ncbi:ABC transporter substrate-binding protein [Mycolicibacterium confluentis]|uniref:LacI family transcriptional regulator n=1 Tax=Mycolicibacterium confluentis TaxID=28047 RepID=A0A7I7Y166_9MYCO|nr:ABC transporter substrate-binding protein [Mycolicibacterium confluentis]MCV7320049.1 ABC transporter substrate-binding protein [Mycolicibacterium confluentis]ORV34596.1 LacI family transcriptional regulator [Mycolicibacterium confluentis]BBZ35084.1 LacI family transcriptional regulator [Mycolicibacterium confluentis]